IRYYAADFNEPALPRSHYDAVFFHQSLHHVGKLEKLLKAVLLALKPEGLLYLDEYVGPSRTAWVDASLLRHQREFYAAVARDVRKRDDVPVPIAYDDPSEAIRSGEILAKLRVGFELEQQRDYGGNLLTLLYPAVDWTRADSQLLTQMIECEDEL